MHRLFWKIFVSFWVALILFSIAVLFATSSYLDKVRAQRSATNPRAQMRSTIAAAQSAADQGGIKGLRAWARRTDSRALIPVLVLDNTGHDLLNRRVPPAIVRRIQRRKIHAARHPRRHKHFTPAIHLFGHRNYWLIPDFRSVTLERVLQRPRVMLVPLVVAALISGLVCLLLARYLTAPLSRLRKATEAYAAGNLDYRVMPTMGRRRDEIANLALAFDQMAGRLQMLMTTQRQLLRDVSHELRSPLARLEVALGLARQRAPDRNMPELARIEREAERLNELIGGLLSLARFESDIELPERESVDLEELLRSVVADAAYEAQAHKRKVCIAASMPVTVEVNPPLLHSAIENVVRNAVRYTREDTTVELCLRRHPRRTGWVWLEIRDHGPGVPEDLLPGLFKAFVRVEEARDRASGGYGLGLAIAYQAIRLHSGRIWACNAADGGLRVIIELPSELRQRTVKRESTA